MNTALIILASALAIAAFLGGCLGTCKTGKKASANMTITMAMIRIAEAKKAVAIV